MSHRSVWQLRLRQDHPGSRLDVAIRTRPPRSRLLAWDSPGGRRSLTESASTIRDFIHEHSEWVIEGCYGDLLEQVLPYASEVRFLNPGVEACIANCRARPWEPEKYPSNEAQDQKLDFLLDWVREYESRADEYPLARHRELFEGFRGPKVELSSLPV